MKKRNVENRDSWWAKKMFDDPYCTYKVVPRSHKLTHPLYYITTAIPSAKHLPVVNQLSYNVGPPNVMWTCVLLYKPTNYPYGSKHFLRRYLTPQIIPQTRPKKVLGSIGIEL